MGFVIEKNDLVEFIEEKGVTAAVIPDGVTVIKDKAFEHCEHLTDLFIPASMIGYWSTLPRCKSLKAFHVSKENPKYASENGILYNKEKTELFYVPAGLSEAVIPEGVKSVHWNAFDYCQNLTSISIPNSMETFHGLLEGCDSLTTIHVREDHPLFAIENGILYNKKGTVLTCCPGLKELKVGADNPYFSSVNGMLCNKEKTELIKCPVSIRDVVIPDGIRTVRNDAFNYCQKMSSLSIPNSMEDFNCALFSDELTELLVHKDHPYLTSVNGVLYNKDQTVLVRCPSGIEMNTLIVPDGVEKIADNAFYCCSALRKIILPDSVQYIGREAFLGCRSLKSIRMPAYLPSTIQDYTFSGCFELEEINIPNGVTNICWSAFQGCKSLKRITLGKEVAVLHENRIYIMNLEQIIVDPENAHFASENGILYNKEKSILLRCPTGKYGDIVIPDGVTQIGDDQRINAFRCCNRVASIRIPASVTQISSSAFEGCHALVSFAAPNVAIQMI